MIDVHLIGYTADLEHLVLDLDGESSGRYRLIVDPDLLATLLEIRTRCIEEGRPWPGDELVGWDDDEVDEEELEELDEPDDDLADELEDEDGWEDEWDDELALEEDLAAAADAEPAAPAGADRAQPEPPPRPAPRAAEAPRTTQPQPPSERRTAPAPDRAPTRAPTPTAESARPDPKLSPAQIQNLLRSGKSPASVAKAADTDVAWIERWLPPILEERARVLREAHGLKLTRPRLGTSRAALGEAVRRALAERKVDPDDITWETVRRNDGRWRVSVKYRHRNRSRTASWTYDPRDGEIEPASDLAKQLGFRPAKRRSAKTSGSAKSSKAAKATKATTSSASSARAAPSDSGPAASADDPDEGPAPSQRPSGDGG